MKGWYTSKTKIGTGLLGLGSIWNYTRPGIISAVITALGGVLTAWGVRDWPIVNKEE